MTGGRRVTIAAARVLGFVAVLGIVLVVVDQISLRWPLLGWLVLAMIVAALIADESRRIGGAR